MRRADKLYREYQRWNWVFWALTVALSVAGVLYGVTLIMALVKGESLESDLFWPSTIAVIVLLVAFYQVGKVVARKQWQLHREATSLFRSQLKGKK